MENITLSKRSQEKIQSLIDNKDGLVKELQDKVQKNYQENLNDLEKRFSSQLEAFINGIVSQLADDDGEYVLTKEEDEFVLKPKTPEDGDIQHDDKQSE